MEERKHQNCTFLYTDSINNLQWVEKLPDGRLFSLMAHGKPDDARSAAPSTQYLFGRISEDGGKTWGHPYFLYEWPERNTAFCVQGWKSDHKGYIHVFASAITVYNPEKNELAGHIGYVRFDSYRGENPLYSDIPALYRYTGSLNNAIETDAGRIVVPFSTYMDGKFVSNTIWSDDHGDTWYASTDVTIVDKETNCESGAVEPVVAEVKPGVLVMLIRTVLDRLWYAVSYDSGERWSEPKPTKLPSSNSPATLQKMPDGRIVLVWNDCLGHPMANVRYSSARQCLHAAISDDGLRTVHGARIVAKKVIGDQNGVHNAYPTTAMANEKEILLKYFDVWGKNGSTWKSVQAYLTLLDPDFLEETDVQNNWAEWVSDLDKSEAGIVMRTTDDDVAHAITSFPYGTKGRIKLTTAGTLPENCRILLSDCYLDRLNFMPNRRAAGYEEVIGKPYTELVPNASGEWVIEWDKSAVTLLVDDSVVHTQPKHTAGFNHVTVLFSGDGELSLTEFSAHAYEAAWGTGIEY
ncbi:MAG: exo-alpha-sialidase [Ruminococcaceae bacterium]|nr:exo-alpha-sialidase [Oscillospiraceae bacterium]